MTIGLLALTIAAFLLVLDRRDKRAHEERQGHRREIAALCLKIQAPEVAIAEHQAEGARDLPAVDPFDHRDYWDAKDEEQKALARIAELERELN